MGRRPGAAEVRATPPPVEIDPAASAKGAVPPEAAIGTTEGARRGAVALAFPLAVTTLALTYWCVDIVSPALPEIRRSLGLSGAGAGLVFTAFFGGRLLTNLPAGFLVDRIGPRRTTGVGAALLLVGSILAAAAGGEASLLPARALQGVGVALLATAGLLSLLRTRPGGGAAMTAFNVAAGVGGSAGLISGGFLTGAVGWRAVFALSAGLGTAILFVAVVGRVNPGSAAEPKDRHPAEGVERRSATSRRALVGALLANLLVYGNYSIWIVALPLYAADRFDADAERIGGLLLVINVVHLLATVPVGQAIRRAGATRALAVGCGLTGVGLALVPIAPGQVWLLGPMTFYAVGQVAGNSAAGDLLLRLGGRGGRAVAMVRLTSDVGLVAGPVAVGALADAAGTSAPFPVLSLVSGLAGVATWRAVARARGG